MLIGVTVAPRILMGRPVLCLCAVCARMFRVGGDFLDAFSELSCKIGWTADGSPISLLIDGESIYRYLGLFIDISI